MCPARLQGATAEPPRGPRSVSLSGDSRGTAEGAVLRRDSPSRFRFKGECASQLAATMLSRSRPHGPPGCTLGLKPHHSCGR